MLLTARKMVMKQQSNLQGFLYSVGKISWKGINVEILQSLKNRVLEVYLESLICRNCMVKAEVLDAFLYRVVDENVTVGKINIHFFWFFGSLVLFWAFMVSHGVEELCPVRKVTDSPLRPCLTLTRRGKPSWVLVWVMWNELVDFPYNQSVNSLLNLVSMKAHHEVRHK